MKKFLSIIAFAVLVLALSATAFAADSDIIASGYCGGEGDGTNLEWTLTEDGTLTISGEGAMQEDQFASMTKYQWWDYLDNIKSIVLEEGITTIGSAAFEYCHDLTGEFIIPQSVVTIGNYLFNSSENCFTGSLVIPDKVTSIGGGAFRNCDGFNGNLVIGKSVEVIKWNAFSDCSNFKGDVVFSKNLRSIEYTAFKNCGINEYYFEGDAPTVGSNAFDASSDTIYYPAGNSSWKIVDGKWNGYTAVAYSPTSGYCGGEGDGTNLEWSFDESAGVLAISGTGRMADYEYSYSSIHGKNITEAPWGYYTDYITSIEIEDGITYIGNSAFYRLSNAVGTLAIPETVTEIGENAFAYCWGLNGELVLPENLNKIGKEAFYYCYGFKGNITVPDEVESIGELAFAYCKGMDGNIVLGSSVEKIENYAFYMCPNLSGSAAVPESVSEIGDYAFSDCGISEYHFEGDAPSVGSSAFDDSSDTIYYPKGNNTWIIENGKWNGYTAVPYSDEPDATLSISTSKTAEGREAAVSVSISENSNAVMAQFAVKYDSSVLELVSAAAGDFMKGAMINSADPGIIYFAWDGDAPVTAAEELLTLKFEAKEGAEPGDYPVEIDTTKEFVFSRTDSSDLNVEIENGKITVIEGLYGDVNGDSRVNIKDAYFVRLIAAKLIKPTEEQLLLCDVDLDGRITAIDANIIRKFCVNLIKVLPVEV